MSKISILRKIQAKRAGGFIMSEEIENDVVAVVKKGNIQRFINQSPKSKSNHLTIDNDKYIIEPYIPLDVERFIIFLSAESGSGKTLLSSIFITQYAEHFPQNKMYYICNTRKEDDPNLNCIRNLTQIDTENIEEIKIEDLTDSLVVVDDTDFHQDHKKIMKFMNIVVECGRKFGTSLIYSSHIHSKLSESPIYKEVSLYITFQNSLINNRMLTNNLKISEGVIENLMRNENAYICFNKIYKTIITDKLIWKY